MEETAGCEHLTKGVFHFSQKRLFRPGEDLSFLPEQILIKMGTAHRSLKFTNYKIHDHHRSNNHHKTGHGQKLHNRSTFLQIRVSPFAQPVHRQNLPRPCIRLYSHRQSRLLGRLYPPRIAYGVRCRHIRNASFRVSSISSKASKTSNMLSLIQHSPIKPLGMFS